MARLNPQRRALIKAAKVRSDKERPIVPMIPILNVSKRGNVFAQGSCHDKFESFSGVLRAPMWGDGARDSDDIRNKSAHRNAGSYRPLGKNRPKPE